MRFILLLLISLFPFSTFASSFPDDPYISVTGNASLAIEADQVIIQFQPSAVDKSGEVAKQIVDQQVTLLLKQLQQAGFNVDEVQSISQSSRAEYDYQQKKRQLLGVRVTHELSYRLTDISRVNAFLDALLSAKVDTISALRYGLQNPQQWQDKVRKMAVLDSQQKAQNVAQLYDAKLGNVYSINYQNNEATPVYMRAASMESDAVNVKPKNITLNDRVSVVFILKP